MRLLYPGSDMDQHYTRNIAEWEAIPSTWQRKFRSSFVVWQRSMEIFFKKCVITFFFFTFQILIAKLLRISVLWNITPCRLANIGCLFFCSTDMRRSNAPPDALPALLSRPGVGEVEQSMTGGRQTVALTVTCRKSNKNSLEHRAGVYRSTSKKHPIVKDVREDYCAFCPLFDAVWHPRRPESSSGFVISQW